MTAPDLSTCALFSVDPFNPTLTGAFSSAADVALFEFSLTTATLFSASASGAFDPLFGLFHGADSPDAGRVVLYPGTDGELYRAVSVDDVFGPDGLPTSEALPDPMLQSSLLLGQGTYVLALMQAGNNFQFSEFLVGGLRYDLEYLPAGFELSGNTESCGSDGAASCAFSLNLAATPVNSASVPEPGTLSLLALGSAAGALIRRRRTRRPPP